MRKIARTRTAGTSALLFGFVAVAWCFGCSSSSSSGGGDSAPDAAPVASEAGPSGAQPPYCTDKTPLPGVPDVSGIWAIRALATQIVTAPVVGSLHPKSLFYMLVSLTQSGANIAADGSYCDRGEIDQPGSLATVVLPEAWAHTEKPFRRSGTLIADTNGNARLNFPTLVELAGAVPGDGTDALPVDANDPRVLDEDHDGQPGITINLVGVVSGSLYVAQRQTTALTATQVAPGRFEGGLDFNSEQKMLGGSSSTLITLYSAAVSSPDPTPCASTFTMIKVADLPSTGGLDGSALDGGGSAMLSCEWLRAQEAALFP
jgi:hypothetical protein